MTGRFITNKKHKALLIIICNLIPGTSLLHWIRSGLSYICDIQHWLIFPWFWWLDTNGALTWEGRKTENGLL